MFAGKNSKAPLFSKGQHVPPNPEDDFHCVLLQCTFIFKHFRTSFCTSVEKVPAEIILHLANFNNMIWREAIYWITVAAHYQNCLGRVSARPVMLIECEIRFFSNKTEFQCMNIFLYCTQMCRNGCNVDNVCDNPKAVLHYLMKFRAFSHELLTWMVQHYFSPSEWISGSSGNGIKLPHYVLHLGSVQVLTRNAVRWYL